MYCEILITAFYIILLQYIIIKSNGNFIHFIYYKLPYHFSFKELFQRIKFIRKEVAIIHVSNHLNLSN